MLWWILLALAGLAAAGASSAEGAGEKVPGKVPGKGHFKKWLTQGPQVRDGIAGTRPGGVPPPTSSGSPAPTEEAPPLWTSGGQPVGQTIYLPPGRHGISIAARLPNIDGGVSFAGKEYGYAKGPPGSAPVLQAVSSAATAAVSLIAAGAAEAQPTYAAAIGAVNKILSSVLEALPNAIAKFRVKRWARWRAGKYGDKAERARMVAEVENWLSIDNIGGGGTPAGRWWFEGDAAGEWAPRPEPPRDPNAPGKPVSPGDPIAGPPAVAATVINDGWLRVAITTQPSNYDGEIRYDTIISKE